MTSDPLLAVRELAKSYGPRRALDAVSFTVRPGEVLGLIGPNGAGKTTLFECLAGVLPADAGEVRGSAGTPQRSRKKSRTRQTGWSGHGAMPSGT